MSKLIGTFGTGHILMSRGSAGEAGERAFNGMREIGQIIAKKQPDILIIVSSDHFYNFHGNEQNTFLIGDAISYQSFGDMDLPITQIQGSPKLAKQILEKAQSQHFPIETLDQTYKPDHGVMIPFLMTGLTNIEVIPVISNLALEKNPTMMQGWQLGKIIQQVIQESEDDKKIIIIGTGGLSHWLGVPEMGRINSDFDMQIINKMVSGKSEELSQLTREYVLEHGGNGGLEIVNWLVMAGSNPSALGKKIYYEATAEWLTGLGGIEIFVNQENA